MQGEFTHYRRAVENFKFWFDQYKGLDKIVFDKVEREEKRNVFWRFGRAVKLVFHQHFNPRDYWRDVKSFWQRGHRGWADRDVWDFRHYLCEVIPAAIDHLRQTKHGIPMHVEDEKGNVLYCASPPKYCPPEHDNVPHFHGVKDDLTIDDTEQWAWEGKENTPKMAMDAADEMWSNQLTQIAAAFREYKDLDDWGYEEGLSKEEIARRIDENIAKYPIVKKKLEVLIRNFDALWD